jgi:hypothetical protein
MADHGFDPLMHEPERLRIAATPAALAEHYAQGRLTFDELNLRLKVTLTARTYGQLSRVARDLPG